MNKLLKSLGLLVAVAALGALTGCELYFGPDHGGSWSYCGADGQYSCQGNDCQWVGPTCTTGSGSAMGGSGSAGSGSGATCTDNSMCAPGCYCDNGTCTEGGFCTQDSDCGPGYFCDVNRSSCEPGCTSTAECPAGSACTPEAAGSGTTGQCTTTCTCTTDADATAAGYGWCNNGTCDYGTDPNGSCIGDVTCATAQPTCPSGQVPTITNGCWTGNCTAYAACDAAPVCTHINDEMDCLGRTDCGATYTGINCTKPDGSACRAGDTGCTCQNFVFNSCSSKSSMRQVFVNSLGEQVDASGWLHQ